MASLSEKRIIREASDFWVEVRARPRSCAIFSVVMRMSTLMVLCVCWVRGRQWKYDPLRLSRTVRPAAPARVAMYWSSAAVSCARVSMPAARAGGASSPRAPRARPADPPTTSSRRPVDRPGAVDRVGHASSSPSASWHRRATDEIVSRPYRKPRGLVERMPRTYSRPSPLTQPVELRW